MTALSNPESETSQPPQLPRALPMEELRPQGRDRHPTVYLTPEDVERARRNAARCEWACKAYDDILAAAQSWLEKSEEEWLRFLPQPGACYAYGRTGCPICGASWGLWLSARCSWDNPRHVTCANGHLLPDDEHPDDGDGYQAPDGRVHYFVGSWNAWVTEQWTHNAIPSLARAYALTGDEKYAERAAFFLDALASIYAESTSGSWDYPSRPPSGRLARPWYQVARNLVVFVEAYDLIYESSVLDRPSLRPTLEREFPRGAPPQTRVVGTPEAHGQSTPGMTRRQNIDLNLMQDAAYYCYSYSFGGRLHNGHADYMRGALAVGCLLGISEYVRWATEGPYSIYAMLANNVDRDGRYYETSLQYAHSTRRLYLSFAEPLINWRDPQHPQGIDLFRDPRFRRFYILPDLVMHCVGHFPNFGDARPDNSFVPPSETGFSATDHAFAERMYAGSRHPEDKRLFAAILKYLSDGNLDRLRAESNMGAWLLFHADELPPDTPDLPPQLLSKIHGSWFLGQKGLGLLRTGEGDTRQAALLRWGQTLAHGDYDELGLLYYGGGWQLTYEIGYGPANIHTHMGWANHTASHNGVVVNETSQIQVAGSGGSLHLFARMPGFQALEASDENAYRSEGVKLYRRTVALIGEGRAAQTSSSPPCDTPYLVDIFRVVGGRQHDYFLGAQSQKCDVEGVSLGPEEPGSLAGPDISWGTKIGNDGNIIGFPNKPYWNPPPGNGYGFFYGVRRGSPESAWRATWRLGGPLDTNFRAHFLPQTGSEAIFAKAPGLYPEVEYSASPTRSASYAITRRRGEEPLASSFVTIMEPSTRPFIKSVERLSYTCTDEAELEPVGVGITHVDGQIDYLFSGGLRDARTVFHTEQGDIEVGGALAYLRVTPQGGVVRAVLHGADWLRFGDWYMEAPARAYEGMVMRVDEEHGTIYTSVRLPPDGRLNGQMVYFANDAYSRTSAYELQHVEAAGEGSVLHFGDTPFILGRGEVLRVEDEHTLHSSIPHEYALPVGGSPKGGFFDGKLVTNSRGVATRLTYVEFGVAGQPTTLEVESTDGFAPGDVLFYHDLQAGDRFVLPTTTVSRGR